jgi:hypothetical protein
MTFLARRPSIASHTWLLRSSFGVLATIVVSRPAVTTAAPARSLYRPGVMLEPAGSSSPAPNLTRFRAPRRDEGRSPPSARWCEDGAVGHGSGSTDRSGSSIVGAEDDGFTPTTYVPRNA